MVAQSKDIIFHNYSQSPVAEKVRVGFGIKQLKWYSVEIPRLPPKPMLTKLTGGSLPPKMVERWSRPNKAATTIIMKHLPRL